MQFEKLQSFSKQLFVLGTCIFWDIELEPHFQKELSTATLKNGLF